MMVKNLLTKPQRSIRIKKKYDVLICRVDVQRVVEDVGGGLVVLGHAFRAEVHHVDRSRGVREEETLRSCVQRQTGHVNVVRHQRYG